MRPPLPAATPTRRDLPGFGLLEMMVCSALIAVLAAGAAASLLVGNRTSRSQGRLSSIDALIDQDLAAIQAKDRRLTCCSGTCTDGIPANSSGVCESVPGNENYYAPKQDSAPTNAQISAMDQFTTLCRSATSAASIATALLPVQDNSQWVNVSPLQIRRQVQLIDANSNRLRITYTGSISGTTVSTRSVDLIPLAAGWCP